MTRTIVYASTAARSTPAPAPDRLSSKIAKYVPAEVVALASMFFAVFTVTGVMIWCCVAAGALINVAYLYSVARTSTDAPVPLRVFYPLSALAFGLWAIATIDPVARAAHLSGDTGSGQRAFVLVLAAFLVPLLDTVLTFPAGRSKISRRPRGLRRRDRAGRRAGGTGPDRAEPRVPQQGAGQQGAGQQGAGQQGAGQQGAAQQGAAQQDAGQQNADRPGDGQPDGEVIVAGSGAAAGPPRRRRL